MLNIYYINIYFTRRAVFIILSTDNAYNDQPSWVTIPSVQFSVIEVVLQNVAEDQAICLSVYSRLFQWTWQIVTRKCLVFKCPPPRRVLTSYACGELLTQRRRPFCCAIFTGFAPRFQPSLQGPLDGRPGLTRRRARRALSDQWDHLCIGEGSSDFIGKVAKQRFIHYVRSGR